MQHPGIVLPRENQIAAIPYQQSNNPTVYTYVTYDEVFGRTCTYGDLTHTLSKINLHEVLRNIALLNVLFTSPAPVHFEAHGAFQVNVVQALFDMDTRQLLAGSRWGTKPAYVTIFHRQQQLFLLQLAMTSCPTVGGLNWDKEAKQAFGEACLMANTFFNQHHESLNKNGDELALMASTLPLFDFSADSNWTSLVSRANQLWLAIPKDTLALKKSSQMKFNPDFNQHVRNKYQFDLDDYVVVVVGLVSHIMRFDRKDPENFVKFIAFNIDQVFKDTRVDRGIVIKVLSEVSKALPEFAILLSGNRHSASWDFTTLRKYPLVAISEVDFIITDVALLWSLLTDRIYWLVNDALEASDQEKFKSFFGTMFEILVERYLHRIVPASSVILPCLYSNVKFKGTQDEVCDEIIEYDKTACMMELKSKPLTPNEKYSGSGGPLQKALDGQFGGKKGTGQLASSIGRLVGGEETSVNKFDFKNIDSVIPILVTYDTAIATPLIQRWLNKQFGKSLGQSNAVSSSTDVKRLVVLSINDVSLLESISRKHPVKEVFARYCQDAGEYETFSYFIRRNYRDSLNATDTLLSEDAQKIIEMSIERLFQGELVSESK